MAAKSPFAEAVSLTGKVTDQGGRPLAGVAVSLVAAPQISDTTGGDGTFTLMGITSALRFHATKHVGNGPAQVTLGRHDGFVFLKGTEADSPEGYDARGARMPTVPAAREERGAPPLGNADVTQENSGKVLSKIASLDFVEASKPGYAVRRVPIESYSGIVNISLTASPDFGPNVFVFDPGMPMARIQSRVDSIFKQNERGEFTSQHYAYLFKPGQYSLDVNIPFYAEALGLGTTPDSVAITGQVRSSAAWRNGNATTTFWRSCANLAVTPSSGYARWVVSQGAPFRRMHIKGHLLLSDNGWSSGGFIADSKIDGTVYSGSQQQWLSRNSSWGGWNGGSWNMMFVGIDKPPAGTWPTPPYTVIAKTPLIREKPYLVIDAAGNYSVMVPPLLKDSSLGAGWLNGTAGNPGTGKADTAQIPIDRFYIAHADVDNAASLNAALSQGKHLLLTPGVYHLESSLQVTLAGTVILGLGLPCLAPDNGTPAITTADVDGLKIAGLILEAGAANSPTLLQMGPDAVGPGNMGATGADHAADPSTVQDVFCRAGDPSTDWRRA